MFQKKKKKIGGQYVDGNMLLLINMLKQKEKIIWVTSDITILRFLLLFSGLM